MEMETEEEDLFNISVTNIFEEESYKYEIEKKNIFPFFTTLEIENRNASERIKFCSDPVKPFINIVIPQERNKGTIVPELIKLFKRHLIDCEFLENEKEVKGIWGIDLSDTFYGKFRFVFDCDSKVFKSLEILRQCISDLKIRLQTDNNKKAHTRFFYKDKGIPNQELELFMISELLPDDIKNTKGLNFEIPIFGSNGFGEKTIGFLSGEKNSKWKYFSSHELIPDPMVDINNERESFRFPLNKKEFENLLISNINSKTCKKIEILNRKISTMVDITEATFSENKEISRTTPKFSSKIQQFMAEYPFEEIWSLFGHKDREVAFRMNDIFKRKLFFENVQDFKKSVGIYKPDEIHFGSLCNVIKGPNNEISIKTYAKELCFDIDLNDYYSEEFQARNCCKGERIACEKCWKFADIAAKILFLFLTKCFGFKKIGFFFSGRRGFHCIVFDESVKKFSVVQRKQLLQFIHLPTPKKCLPIIEEIYEKYAKESLESIIQDQGTNLQNIYQQALNLYDSPFNQIYATLFILWPRFDKEVTTGTSHLIKSPYLRHSVTNRICVGFNPMSNFNPYKQNEN